MKQALPLVALAGLLLILGAGLGRLPHQLGQLNKNRPLFAAWDRPLDHYRQALGDVPFDLLLQADRLLPREAAVLLVTAGTDVRHLEYTTYHRALYYLTPRPVWWLSPAPPDGTWEARWWISAALTAESIRGVAAAQGVDCLLAFQVELPPGTGRPVADLGRGQIGSLTGSQESCLASGSQSSRPMAVTGFWIPRLILALAVVMVIGYAGLAYVRRAGYQPTKLEAAGLAWLFGTGLLTLAMLGLSALGLDLERQRTVLSLAAAVLGAGLVWRARPLSRPRLPRPNHPSLLQSLILLLILFQIGYVLLMATGRPLIVWDSWVNWAMKARTIFVEGGLTPAVYGDWSRASTMPDYPLHIPLLESWLYGWLGAADDRLAGIQVLAFFLALAAIIFPAIRREGGSTTLALAVTAAALSIGYVAGLATLVMADIPLAFLATAAAVYLADWLRDGLPGRLIVATTAAALLPWTKREGWILVAVLLVVVLLVSAGAGRRRSRLLTRRAWIAGGVILLAATAVAGPWQLFALANSPPNPNFMAATPAAFLANLDRLPEISAGVAAHLVSAPFNLVWPVLLIVVLAWLVLRPAFAAGMSPDTLILPGVALLYLLITTLLYVFSDYAPFQQHVASSAYRLAAHVVVLPVIWLGLLVATPAAVAPAE